MTVTADKGSLLSELPRCDANCELLRHVAAQTAGFGRAVEGATLALLDVWMRGAPSVLRALFEGDEKEAALDVALAIVPGKIDDGATAVARGVRRGLRQVKIKSVHGARHLEGTGIASEIVESAITKHVQEATKEVRESGRFWGRVTVEGQAVEYRAFTLPDGTVIVGTYYPVVP